MPKFFYTIVVATILAWIGVLFLGSEIAPSSTFKIIIFMFSIFIALGITLTTLAFVYFNYRASLFMNRHILFRRSLKYGYFAAFYISGVLTLRAFDLGTVINYLLFTVLCAVVYKQLKTARI